jgi:hypothetical protein
MERRAYLKHGRQLRRKHHVPLGLELAGEVRLLPVQLHGVSAVPDTRKEGGTYLARGHLHEHAVVHEECDVRLGLGGAGVHAPVLLHVDRPHALLPAAALQAQLEHPVRLGHVSRAQHTKSRTRAPSS